MPARPAGRASCTPPATGKARAYTPTSTLQNVLYPKPQQRPRSAHAAAPTQQQQRSSSAKATTPVEVAIATDLPPPRHPPPPPPPPGYRSVEVGRAGPSGPSMPEEPSACCGAVHTPEPREPRGVMACQRKPSANPGRPSSANPSSGGGRLASRSGVGPPSSRHAQDDMVVPTLRRGCGGGSSGCGGPPSSSRACGVVPVGRDSPIGLDLRRFLSAPDPFGQMGGGRQPSLTAEQTFAALRAPSGQMQQILSSRLAHLRVVAALWAAGGAARAVEHVLNLDDEAVVRGRPPSPPPSPSPSPSPPLLKHSPHCHPKHASEYPPT